MSQDDEVQNALKALRDALNRSGKNIDVRVSRIDVTNIGSQSPCYVYDVMAWVIEPIELQSPKTQTQ